MRTAEPLSHLDGDFSSRPNVTLSEAIQLTTAFRRTNVWVDVLPIKVYCSGEMSTQQETERLELLQGTLDLLILRTLIFGARHGQGIARAIQQTSEQELLVEHGALYPALQRLEQRGWISAKWGTSSNNRKARFYSLTAGGRKELVNATSKWNRLAKAIGRILGTEVAGG